MAAVSGHGGHGQEGADGGRADGRLEAVVGAEDAGRLDIALAAAFAGRLSRSRLQSLIGAGAVRVNGAPALQARGKVKAGDRLSVVVPPPEPALPRPQAMDLAILHEDAALIVIDKPAGLTVHPGAGQPDGTLVNALIAHCGDSLSGIGGVRRPGIVHRLDKDTSGVMVAAKTDAAHAALSAQFADHGRAGALDRRYLALVWGAPPRPSGLVDAPLGRSGTDRTKRAVVPMSHPDARAALTHYAVRERFGPASRPVACLVECRLETGRTHQIRVHMAHVGCPLIGDPLYGRGFATRAGTLPTPAADAARTLGRQALHAAVLAFAHPDDGRLLRFESPPPADMARLIDALRAIPAS